MTLEYTTPLASPPPSPSPDLAETARRFQPSDDVAWAYLDRASPYETGGKSPLELRRICERSTLIVLLLDQKPCERALRREPFRRHRTPGGRILVVNTTADGLEPWVEFVRQRSRSGTEIVRSPRPGEYEPVPLPFGGAPTTLPRRGV